MTKVANYINEQKLLVSILFNNSSNFDSLIRSVNFEKFTKLTSSHLMLPSLYVNIKEKNIENKIPIEFYNYINEIFILNQERNIELVTEMNEISNVLNSSNLDYSFIKGPAILTTNLFKNRGERMIGDIDILVKKEDSIMAKEILENIGYISKKNKKVFKIEGIHFDRQINKNKIFAIEIHNQLLKKSGLINEKKFLKNKLTINGLNVPKISDLLYHNIYNYQINDFGYNYLNYSFRSYYDTYIISKKINKINVNDSILSTYFYLAENIGVNFGNTNKFKVDYLTKLIIKLKDKFKFFYLIFRVYTKFKINYLIKIKKFRKILFEKKIRKKLIHNLTTSYSSKKNIEN